MNTTSIIVWDQEDDPPETMMNVLCWQGYSHSEKILSIPRYIEEHAERLRTNYIAFIRDLGQSNIDGKRIIEHMDKGDGFSFWWMTRLSEKNNCRSNRISHCLRLMALEEILLKNNPSELTLLSSDRKLGQVIKRLCKSLKIKFNWRYGKESKKSFSILALFQTLPYPLKGLLSLRHILRRWSLRKFKKPIWFSGKNSIFMCSYFFDMDSVSCSEGRFHSHQWENLPKYIHDCGRRTNWLYPYYDHSGGHSLKNGVSWFDRFNLEAEKQGYHAFLETYLSWKVLLQTLKNWLWLATVSWRLRRVRHAFTPNRSNVWLWPFLKDDWFDSLTGPTAFFNCLWVELFDVALKDLPYQKTGFYLWENQGWESALLRAWYRNGHGVIIGVQNTTVPFWHLYNFEDPRTLTESDKNAKLLPNKIALNGPMAWNTLQKSGYPVERLVEAEAVRYHYLAKWSRSLGKLNLESADVELSRSLRQSLSNKVIVLGGFVFEKTLDLLRCVENALRLLNFQVPLILKPHPACPIKRSDFPNLSFDIINKPIADIIQDFDLALSGSETSAGMDALLAGLSVAIYLDGDDLNLSPLRGVKGAEFISNAKELAGLIKGRKCRDTAPIVDDFFWLDDQFPRWSRILSDSRIKSD